MNGTVYLSGKLKWAKLINPGLAWDKKNTEWSVCIYPDPESWQVYEKTGLQTRVKEDKDGKFLTFKRSTRRPIKGVMTDMAPPSLVDKDNKNLTKSIGNGSEGVVKLRVYDTIRGVGSELQGVMITNLVEYEQGGNDGVRPEGVVPF